MTAIEEIKIKVEQLLFCPEKDGQQQAEGALNRIRDLLEFADIYTYVRQDLLDECVALFEERKDMPVWKMGFIFQLMEELCLRSGGASPDFRKMVDLWIHYNPKHRKYLVGYTLLLMPFGAGKSFKPTVMSYLNHEDPWIKNAAERAMRYLDR